MIRPVLCDRAAKLNCALLVSLIARTVTAEFIDQSSSPVPGQCYNLRSATPLAQEFVPTFARLDFVDLWLQDAGTNISQGATIQLNIRADGWTGPIVTTTTAFLPDNFNLGGGQMLTRFEFSNPASLIPGQLYAMEAFQTSPIIVTPPQTSNVNCFWCGSTTVGGSYLRGRGVTQGIVQEGFDFGFRTGALAIPECDTVMLLLLGCAGNWILGFWHPRMNLKSSLHMEALRRP
jgi:hypothetical protein